MRKENKESFVPLRDRDLDLLLDLAGDSIHSYFNGTIFRFFYYDEFLETDELFAVCLG